MHFDLFNFVNCMVEAMVLLLFWRLLDLYEFHKCNYLIAYVAICTSASVIVFMNASGMYILILNFLLVFLSMWGGFRHAFLETMIHTLFSFLLLLYLQCIGVCILPQDLMGTNTGNLLVNLSVLVIGVVLVVLARHYHWSEMYLHNKKAIWLFLLALCVPEIIIAQFFASLVGDATTAVMVILLLLQLLYMSLVVLFFFVLKQQANRRHWDDTQRHIEELNAHLEESRQSMHDFNKHIRYLRNVIAVHAENAQLIGTVNTYCEDLLDIYEKEEILLQLDDPIFRALLYGRRAQAQKNHIQFYLDATAVLPVFPLRDYQLVEIFDNLMDNAFEGVMELREEERWIRATLQVITQKDGSEIHLFCIENPYHTLDFSAVIKDEAYTSKGGPHQGVGLRKVSRIVADTGGKVVLNNLNHVFGVKVIYDIPRVSEVQQKF